MPTFEFNGQQYVTKPWKPSEGSIGEVFAFDTETAPIEEGLPTPFVIGQAYAGGGTIYLIQLKYLPQFFVVHQGSTWVAHNAPFDICVVEDEIKVNFDALIRGKRFWDTALMFRLIKLATDGRVPKQWNLQLVVKELLGVELEKEGTLRTSFGRYRSSDKVYYDQIPPEALVYAAIDAVATFKVFEILYSQMMGLSPKLHLSHKVQLMGAYALSRTSAFGIGFDVERKESFIAVLDEIVSRTTKTLADYGYIKGQKGNQKAYEKIINQCEIPLPYIAKGRRSSKAEDLDEWRGQYPFIEAFLGFKENEKLRGFILKLNQSRVHTKFNSLVNTGRTSSWGPNIQNPPRRPGIRECFVPAAGYCFLIIDYGQLELCALAQACFDRYGHSRMRDLINEGVDLHAWFASVITGKDVADVTKDERQAAKACNFGFPGGLGAKTFVEYALQTYQVRLTLEEAEDLKNKWREAFPELKLYLADTLRDRADFSSLPWCQDQEITVALFKRIIGGETTSKKSDRPYSQDLLDWAFNTILPQLCPECVGVAQGSAELKAEVLRESVTTKTGRIRANATYCQARNTPFQGLAADGAKIALYRLIRAYYRVVNFIHDEYLIEIPVDSDFNAVGANVQAVIIEAMHTVVPDVKIKAEWSVTDRWYKDSKKVFHPGTDKVRIFSEQDHDELLRKKAEQKAQKEKSVLTASSPTGGGNHETQAVLLPSATK